MPPADPVFAVVGIRVDPLRWSAWTNGRSAEAVACRHVEPLPERIARHLCLYPGRVDWPDVEGAA